jgi:hypothetical protein
MTNRSESTRPRAQDAGAGQPRCGVRRRERRVARSQGVIPPEGPGWPRLRTLTPQRRQRERSTSTHLAWATLDLRRGRSRIPHFLVMVNMAGSVVGAEDAGHQATDGAAAEAQGGVPVLALPAGGAGDRGDQPNLAGLGELLPSRERGPVLRVREGVGGEEGTAPSDAREGPSGFRLEAVEYGQDLYSARGLHRLPSAISGPGLKARPA